MTRDFDVLLIEDNPGDARLIEEMLRESEELLKRVDVEHTSIDADPDIPFDDVRIHHETRLSKGLDRLAETDPAVVLLDLGLPDSAGIETLETVVDTTDRTPIVVLTGLDDSGVGIKAIQRGAHEYLAKDDLTDGLLVRSIHHALERVRSAAERTRRREQLEALNRLNRIVQDVTYAAIRTQTREELERAVCDRLVADDGYRFAWIGELERSGDRVTPRVSAGLEEEEEALDPDPIRIDGADEDGPIACTIRTGNVQIASGPDAGIREAAINQGVRSSVTIPIGYEELQYGVIRVHAADPFSEYEIEILERLGDIIGHAIAAIERRRALMSDAVLELEFSAEEFLGDLAPLTEESDGRIGVRSFIEGNEAVLAYGTVEGVDRDRLRHAVDATDDVTDVQVLAGEDGVLEVEFVITDALELFGMVTSYGGRIESATIADGEFRFVAEFPQGRDTRQLTELLTERFPSVSLLAQRTSQRSNGEVTEGHSPLQGLTDRQRAALETAYHAGYFDWPRTSSGEDVAERLGISAATFSEHLRAAEQKLFNGILEDE